MSRRPYKQRDSRPTMKSHSGIRERRECLYLAQLGRHCDEFLRERGQRVGLVRLSYGKEAGDEPAV
jgi:hypothetical protein